MKKFIAFLILFFLLNNSDAQQFATPDKIYGQLFTDIQLSTIFTDSKTFVDCTPARKVGDIMYDYGLAKGANFNLKKFVEKNFLPPFDSTFTNDTTKIPDASSYIKNLWSRLLKKSGKVFAGSSLLPVPYTYIIPGNNLRELNYWDGYFIMLGLKENGDTAMIENMVKNFSFLIDTYGYIPSGNRTYYLGRSQPPFFSLMIALLASLKGDEVYKMYLPQLEKEYNFWMDKTIASKHTIVMPDASVLNRYYDSVTLPRQENFKEDYLIANGNKIPATDDVKPDIISLTAIDEEDPQLKIYRNLRTAAESGWGLSSRWLANEKDMATIQTTNIIPIDLNCLLYNLEMVIAKAKALTNDEIFSNQFKDKATARKKAILKYCWNEKSNFFFDYNFVTKKQNNNITAAGLFPLFVKIATTNQANAVANTTTKYLVKPGGMVTSTHNTGHQWDAPNGLPQLQWIGINGLNNYNQTALAKDIAKRWLSLNDKVYTATGKMLEKYNVEDINKNNTNNISTDGFGSTNGVYLALKNFASK